MSVTADVNRIEIMEWKNADVVMRWVEACDKWNFLLLGGRDVMGHHRLGCPFLCK